jgi:hypothetical protein
MLPRPSAVTPFNHPHATTNIMKFRLCGQPLQSKLNQSSFTGYSQQTVLTVMYDATIIPLPCNIAH